MNSSLSLRRSPMKLRAGPSGLHLFERKTGWNVLVDEVRIPPAQWARAPRQISVALTNACDLACPYCYAPKASGSLDADRLASSVAPDALSNGATGARSNQYNIQALTANWTSGVSVHFGPFGPTSTFVGGSLKPRPAFSATPLRNSTSCQTGRGSPPFAICILQRLGHPNLLWV
jgi:hypothetical protein